MACRGIGRGFHSCSTQCLNAAKAGAWYCSQKARNEVVCVWSLTQYSAYTLTWIFPWSSISHTHVYYILLYDELINKMLTLYLDYFAKKNMFNRTCTFPQDRTGLLLCVKTVHWVSLNMFFNNGSGQTAEIFLFSPLKGLHMYLFANCLSDCYTVHQCFFSYKSRHVFKCICICLCPNSWTSGVPALWIRGNYPIKFRI